VRSPSQIVVATVVGAALLLPTGGAAAAQQLPAAPVIGAAAVAPAGDHFTDVLHDPVDYANPEDQLLIPQATQNAAPRYEQGQLRWDRRDVTDVSVVWSGYGPYALAVGREGQARPVDADRFTSISFRLYNGAAREIAASVSWEHCHPYGDRCTGSLGFIAQPGWGTYDLAVGRATASDGPSGWNGDVLGVRISVSGDPATSTPLALDWVRIHEPAPPVPVTYAGQALVWDADADLSNNLPDRPGWGVLHRGGGEAQFPAAAYPPGTYRFYGTGGLPVAPGTPASVLQVAAPQPVVLDPDMAGGESYAEAAGDAWDFSSSGDVAVIGKSTDVSFADGRMSATNVAGLGDPFVELRMAAPLDTRRYHRLTVRGWLDGPFDLGNGVGGGGHGRLLWHTTDQAPGEDLFNAKELVLYPGISEYVIDLAGDAGRIMEDEMAARPGWIGQVNRLRYDPNEDPSARRWHLDEIALRADDEAAGDRFTVRWRDASPTDQAGTTVSFFADTDAQGYDGVPVAVGVAQVPGDNAVTIDTRSLAAGTYSVYAEATRNGVTGRSYATGPLVVPARASGGAPTAPAPVAPGPTPGPAPGPTPGPAPGPAPAPGPVPAPAPVADPRVADARLAGPSRLDTAVLLSRQAFPSGAPAAVVAFGGGFPDALAAAPLAAATGGPLLLNGGDGLAPVVESELRRLGARTVYVVGGTAAQPASVEHALAALPGVRVVRLAGANRYATASAIAAEADARWRAAGVDRDGTVLLASGQNFPDALAAAPLAAAAALPLLLTDPAGLPDDTAAGLKALGARDVVVVGGPGAVGDGVLSSLRGNVRRLAGATRYATADAVASAAVAAGADPKVVVVAAGTSFPDALAAGPAVSALGGVLLLSDRDQLPDETAARLRAAAPVRSLHVAGGAAALSDAVVSRALDEAGR